MTQQNLTTTVNNSYSQALYELTLEDGSTKTVEEQASSVLKIISENNDFVNLITNPTISQKGNYNEVRLRMNLLAFCDGKTNIFQICNKINIPLKNVCDELKILKRNKILL